VAGAVPLASNRRLTPTHTEFRRAETEKPMGLAA
jgi:hypothetical protein